MELCRNCLDSHVRKHTANAATEPHPCPFKLELYNDDKNIMAMESLDYGDDEPTTEYLRVVLDSGPVSTRETDIDLTEPLHDPADEESTNPGSPSHRQGAQ